MSAATSNPVAGKHDASAAGSAPDRDSVDHGGAVHKVRCAPDIAKDHAASALPLTDLGNAERFRLRYGDDFRFCPEIGWFAWDGRRWALLSEEKDKLPARVMQAVYATVRGIMFEAKLVEATGFGAPEQVVLDIDRRQAVLAEVGKHPELYDRTLADDPERMAEFEKLGHLNRVIKIKPNKEAIIHADLLKVWARASEGNARINCIASLAKNFDDIVIRPESLDQDRMAINCLNGTLRIEQMPKKRPDADIKAGKSKFHTVWGAKLYPHTRGDLITKIANVEWKPAKKCPQYDAFMEQVQPDPEMRKFLDQWGGLSMTGDISEQKMAFFYGQGRNGKGVTVETWAYIAGDYAGSVPIESFLSGGGQRRGDQATPDIARLPGVRFLRVSEPSKGGTLNEGLVKMVTGADPVDARHLNKGFFTFLPEFKMTISGNHKPKIKDNSDGIWRRMQLVPWNVQIPWDQVDRELGDKLRGEASGIFRRLIMGLLDLRQNGLQTPDQITAATQQYRDDSDPLGRFLAQCCLISADVPPRERAASKELYELFVAWGKESGAAEWTTQGFAAAMRDKGFESKHSDGTKWIGVQILVDRSEIESGNWTAVNDSSTDDDRPPGHDSGDPVPGFDD